MISKFFILLFCFFWTFTYDIPSVKSDSDNNIALEIKNDLPKYSLGPGDILSIKIYKFDSFSSTVKVLPDGTINLLRINPLYVKGLTINEANLLITKSLKNIIKNPIVYIDLLQSRPIRINIFGEVQRPGIYSLETNQISQISNTDGGEVLMNNNKGWPTVIDALQQAGGLKTSANLRKIKLRRYNKTSKKIDEININLWNTLLRGEFIKNYEIFDEDSIYVENTEISSQEEKTFISSTNLAPSTITVKVIGEVNNPGDTNVRTSSPIMQAILNAGGFTNKSNKNKVAVLRLNKKGKFVKNIFSIKSLEQNNNYLKDRDVIFVDDSNLSKTSNNLKLLVEPLRPILDTATFYKVFFD